MTAEVATSRNAIMNEDDPKEFRLAPPPEAPRPTGLGNDHGLTDTGEDGADDEVAAGPDTLRPSVRRLVKQYGLDVTAIRGTGPEGRVRVADVMGALGGRAAPPVEGSDEDRAAEALMRARHRAEPDGGAAPTEAAGRPLSAAVASPATSVFECELDALLEHRSRERARNVDVPLLAYFIAAALQALREMPELDTAPRTRLTVLRSRESGTARTTLGPEDLGSLDAMARALGASAETFASAQEASEALPADAVDAETADAGLALYDYGGSGCVLAAPLPLAQGQAALLGIGRPRRQVTIREINGEHVPRAVIFCYLTLTYDPRRVSFERANRFLAAVARYRP